MPGWSSNGGYGAYQGGGPLGNLSSILAGGGEFGYGGMNRGFAGYGQGLEANPYNFNAASPNRLDNVSIMGDRGMVPIPGGGGWMPRGGIGAFGKPSFGYGGYRRMPMMQLQQAAVSPTAAAPAAVAAQNQAG